jgi:hypothetical protein
MTRTQRGSYCNESGRGYGRPREKRHLELVACTQQARLWPRSCVGGRRPESLGVDGLFEELGQMLDEVCARHHAQELAIAVDDR